MLFGFCNENQRVLFGFCNENKGIRGVAKWQNACIIKAKFSQIDVGMRTWWLLSEAVILKATFLCLKDRELLPFPETQHYLQIPFSFQQAKKVSITFLLLRRYGSRVDNRKPSILTYERRQLRRQETFPTELLTASRARPGEPWKVLMGKGRAHQGHGSMLLGCILFFQLISSKVGELAQWLGCTALEADLRGPSTHMGLVTARDSSSRGSGHLLLDFVDPCVHMYT